MRKVLVLLLTIAVVSTIAFGTDFSWKGEIRTRMTNYKDAAMEDAEVTTSLIDSRVRLYTTATMSENLKAVVGFEIGDFVWGSSDFSGNGEEPKNHNSDFENVEVKNAYLEFTPDMMEMLTFRVGLQTYVDQFGSAVFDEDAAGIMVMPQLEGMNINAGFLVLDAYDAKDRIPYFLINLLEEEPTMGDMLLGEYDQSTRNFFILDFNKKMDALNLKGSLYYNIIKDIETSMYLGVGADYMMNDSIEFGGQFLYNTWKQDEDLGDAERTGYFAYLYGKYTMDKMSAKLNFGYAPADTTGDDDSYFTGIMPFAYQYGLEYYFAGDVYDGNGHFDYGGENGSMIIAANLKYDFLFANIGIIRSALDSDPEQDSQAIGTEIDLGIDYELTEGLNFKAVGAMFMPGERTGEDLENGMELSAQFKYSF